jgi:hypothetical protein
MRLPLILSAGFALIALAAIVGECHWVEARTTAPTPSMPREIPWVLVDDVQFQQQEADQSLALPDTPWLLQCEFEGDSDSDGPVFRLEDGRELWIQITYVGYGTWTGNGLGNKYLLSAHSSQAGENADIILESDVKIQAGDEAIFLTLNVHRDDDGKLRVEAGNRKLEWEVPDRIESLKWRSTDQYGSDVRLYQPMK